MRRVAEVSREIICTKRAPSAIGPYAQAVKANQFVFVSGQLPINPETGSIVQGDIEKKQQL